jgi:hypothetical protein
MRQCEVCGNHYAKAFEVIINNQSHIFDSLECAAFKVAPQCAHCQCRILGHGVEVNDVIYCCAHCAKQPAKNNQKNN